MVWKSITGVRYAMYMGGIAPTSTIIATATATETATDG